MLVNPIAAFHDNYIWAIHVDGGVVIVDPGDAAPVLAYLNQKRLKLKAILATHHHADHIGGVSELLSHYPVPVYAPAQVDYPFDYLPCENDASIQVSGTALIFDVFTVPGHTLDHIAFYGQGLLFCGDTLFSGGCGRIFEGTPAMMYASLMRLAALPGETRVYCAHEYTVANLQFAQSVDPNNAALAKRLVECLALRSQRLPTLPSDIQTEQQTNPFLRAAVLGAELAKKTGDERLAGDPVAAFAYLRQLKDQW